MNYNRLFSWQGLSKEGQVVSGEITAANIFAAKLILFEQKILIKKIRRKYRLPQLPKKDHFSEKDRCYFLQQLSTLFAAGIPLIQAMLVLQKNDYNPIFQSVTKAIIKELQNGQPLSLALQKIKPPFDAFSCQLISLGEQTGTLDLVLKRLVIHKEKVLQLKARIKQALFYPSLVLIAASLITLGLLIGVVPQFESFFANASHLLPLPTRIIFSMSHQLNHFGWMIIITLSLAILIFMQAEKRIMRFKLLIQNYTQQLPLLKRIILDRFIIQFTQNLALAYKTGIPLLQGLDILLQTEVNLNFKEAILQIKTAIRNGQPLSVAMGETPLFSAFVIQMVAIGEEAGKLDDMLDKIAMVYEHALDEKIKRYSELVEPLFILFLGLFIGGLVIALYLPVFKLGTVI